MHLGFLDYAHYIITVRFHGLEGFHQRYNIKDLKFYVSLMQTLFTHQTRNTQIHLYFFSSLKPTIRHSLKSRFGFGSFFYYLPS